MCVCLRRYTEECAWCIFFLYILYVCIGKILYKKIWIIYGKTQTHIYTVTTGWGMGSRGEGFMYDALDKESFGRDVTIRTKSINAQLLLKWSLGGQLSILLIVFIFKECPSVIFFIFHANHSSSQICTVIIHSLTLVRSIKKKRAQHYVRFDAIKRNVNLFALDQDARISSSKMREMMS